MYTRQEREGYCGSSTGAACPSGGPAPRCRCSPNPDNLYRWLGLERSGELVAREMPDRASRIHYSHGEGSPAYGGNASRAAARRAPGAQTGADVEDIERHAEQTEWREWAADLPEDPAERARMAEVRLAEPRRCWTSLKAPGPASLENVEKHLAGRAARAMGMGVELADVLRDLSIARSTYHDQAGGARAPTGGAQGARARLVRASGGARLPGVWADLQARRGRARVLARPRAGRPQTPVVVSEGRARHHGRGDLVAAKARQMRRRARYSSYAGERGEGRRPSARGTTRTTSLLPEPGLLVVTDVTGFALDGCRAYLARHRLLRRQARLLDGVGAPDRGLVLGMLRGLVGGQCGRPGERPLTVHTDGGGVYMSGAWAAECEASRGPSMSRKARSPDNARRRASSGTLKCDFFEGRDWVACPSGEFRRGWTPTSGGHRDGKIKKSLGWRTTAEYRRDMGYGDFWSRQVRKNVEVPNARIAFLEHDLFGRNLERNHRWQSKT